jgi:hypothetical protein
MIRKARAGVYAEGRYREGLRSWRRKNRKLFAVASGPFIVAGIAVGIADGHVIAWTAGVVAGGFLALWATFREMPPRYVEKWHDGAEGERKTEKTLRRFERAGWCVVHDVQWRYRNPEGEWGYRNYDHIAVGRAGVYLLETKNLQGIVDIRDGVPRLSRRHDSGKQEAFGHIPKSALSAAANLKEDIEQRTGHRIWVQAIVVFWSEFPEGLVENDKCVFIHGSRLRCWMESRPNRLTEAEAEEIAAGVEAIANDEAAGDVTSDAPAPTPA